MNITQLLHADRLVEDMLRALDEQMAAPKPLPLIVNGLAGGGADALCAEAARRVSTRGVPTLFVVPGEGEAERLTAVLVDAGIRAARFPARDLTLYEYSASHVTERERLFVLHALLAGEADAVVTTPGAATTYTVPADVLRAHTVSLAVGEECPPDEVSARLVSLGYAATELVEAPGQFARRGGILDVFPTSATTPCRVEFFGDEVDRICRFDPISQRVSENMEKLVVLPAHEVIAEDAARRAIRRSVTSCMKDATDTATEELKRTLAALDGGTEICARDRYLSLVYPPTTLADYLSAASPVFLLGTNETTEAMKGATTQRGEWRDAMISGHLLEEKHAVWGEDIRAWEAWLDTRAVVHVNAFTGGTFRREGGLFGFRSRRLPTYADAPRALTDDLGSFLSEKCKVFLICENRASAIGTRDYLCDLGISAVMAPDDLTLDTCEAGVVYLMVGRISSGYEMITARLAVMSLLPDANGENRRRLRATRKKRHKAGETILSYTELHTGDFVVHERYGIGIFEGLETISRDGAARDYITIRYAGTDKLFIPADRLEAVTKYIGAGTDTGSVKLSRMGSPAWQKAKSRAKGAAREMAQELIQLYAARVRLPGIAFSPSPDMEAEFAEGFEYELTEGQLEAVNDILADMTRPTPMDRLLCGDVGFGKTEVALRAAFRAIADGYQVAILVPTTILAMQHYSTALARMRGFAVGVDMLSRFRTAKEVSAIRRRLARGETDLVIGTHALLGNGINFKNLGLLIIDEEQRFGVAQKEKIKSLATGIDVLTLTATPIPRTLNMAMSGIRDMSILDEAPGERRPTETYVLEYNTDVIDTAIRRELARSGQVLYLYNRTEDIDLVAGKLQERHPGARVAYAHGKMEREVIEDIWQALVRGEIDILACTTIIETGVDLPNANTLIIEHADRMGLSQLHQIRGRIGRSSRQAYAYLTYRAGKSLSDISRSRLSAMREYAEFGAGFRIALRDLEIRGAGDLLGASQHGHIESVGYDLYIHLLEEAVLEEQGKTPPPAFESTIDLRIDANIPASYIASSSRRMEMYKKISCIACEADRSDVLDEFCDRFGDPPKPVERLLHIALARATAARCRVTSIERVERELRFLPESPDLAVWSVLFGEIEGFRIPSSRTPYIAVKMKPGEDPARLAAAVMAKWEAVKTQIQTKEEPS